MENSVVIKQKLNRFCGLSNTVILCIGSDRITGDSLGPIVGQLLTSYYNVPAFVYGTLESPVTALNLGSVMTMFAKRHSECKVIAIDSCVGERGEIGKIRTNIGGLMPGSADGKNLPKVGNISITAVTSDHAPSSPEFATVRLGFVYELAKTIAEGINMFFAEKKAFYSELGERTREKII